VKVRAVHVLWFIVLLCSLVYGSSYNVTTPQHHPDRFPDCSEIEFEYCDLDGNGSPWPNIPDIILVVLIILDNQEPTDAQLCAADLNGDEAVNILDLMLGMFPNGPFPGGCWWPGE